MPGRRCPLKKHRNVTDLPLALNPMKSKDVLAVLAERNQAVVPVGAWVEPASPNSSEIPAYTSACIIEEELKEQLRRKEEALKHFQRQVKHRVNQQIRLRKKQQLQKSYEALSSKAEKEGSVAMQSFDPAHLTPKRTSVFPSNSNAAFGSFRFPPSQMLGDAVEDEKNQSHLFQQQAQALSQTMKLARHRLASFKTVSEKMTAVFPNDKRKTSPIQEKVKFKNPLFVVMEEKEQNQWHYQGLQNIPPESQGDLMEVHSVGPEAQSVEPDLQAVKLAVPSTEAESQAVEPEGQAIKTKTQGIMLKTCGIKLEDGNIELEAQDFLPSNQAFLPKDQGILPKDNCVFPEGQNTPHKYQDQNFLHKDQDFLPRNQHVYSKEQDILLKCQDEDFIPEDQDFRHRDQCVLPQDQDQDFLPEDQSFLPGDQCVLPRNENIVPKCQDHDFLPKGQEFLSEDHSIILNYQDQDFLPKDQSVLPKDQNILGKCQKQDFPSKDQKANLKQPASILIVRQGKEELPLDTLQDLFRCHQTFTRDKKVHFKKDPLFDMTDEEERRDISLEGYQYLPPKPQCQNFIKEQNRFLNQTSSFMTEERMREQLPPQYQQYVPPQIQDKSSSRQQHRNCGLASHDLTNERRRKDLFPECSGYAVHETQDPASAREQSLYAVQKASGGTAERQREDLLVEHHQHLMPRDQRGPCSGQQVYKYPSGLSVEFQASLSIHSGIDQEEEKKERQKQYLRHRRLFMDIEREQVKEQKRQKEQKKKNIEKIKKKKEQQCYVDEQKTVRLSSAGALYSEQKMSDSLGQLQLEEIKGTREKQQQREKEYVRYIEALRAQVQEKMKLYNITLPPLCFCGPDFWDAHPDTCANNCIFYKNHRAYNRALYSVISSSDVSEGNSTLRNAIHNFASAHRRILKNT
ncbi:PREDICTED: coiled-coil domain-containing protein 15 isoform X2 [Chinchilla lanigera]|uniref:coiled-coil domain-containing protein 15 isoform X2 n=1 Tax=Chinchilla lanigera TaxID=34839 RepID=UPI00038F03E7|nr:PREDICTED: coiled-coil domain-containing protein 15 isoform X2 [Chinchilla lanigera]